ncbi:hypothetical protein ACIP01_06505 [Pseudomonas monteilii]|uniref:hypothetical protein n=1 Tax=Pseudomonas monteilii TaxID=76759 RepID=UPI00380BA6FE
MKPNLSSKIRSSMWAELFSEYIFIFTPFVFLVAIKLYAYCWREILLAPDWSLVSCIIFGQIAVRMSRSAIKHRSADDAQFGLYSANRFFLVAVSLLMYFGMVAKPTIYLGWAQLGLFLLASYFHFKDGLASRILEARANL